jgi:adenylate kinase family enzyme
MILDKIIIFGNSGAGKSTLAKKRAQSNNLAHFDLDTIAWLPPKALNHSPERMPLEDSKVKIEQFITTNANWVIEGCYADLLEFIMTEATEVIFLDLPVEVCMANAKDRPWEPHKYQSKQAQDKNLPMLLNWIAQYPERTDTFSQQAHQKLFDGFSGKKQRYSCNQNDD